LPRDLDLRFPVIVKPLTRRPMQWAPIGGDGKARRVNSAAELCNLWPRLAAADIPLLVQELVPGDETAIESYHVYVDLSGTVVADFTGKKIRTYPQAFGDSTALTTTHAADVLELGRDIVRRLDLRGVAKFDFKRAPDDASGSGFQRPLAMRYKHTTAAFRLHLDTIAAGPRAPELVTDIDFARSSTHLLLTFDDGGKSALHVSDELCKRGWRAHFLI